MKTYWDLSDQEKSLLNYADVEKFVVIELMEQGISKAVPPTFEVVPECELTPNEVYFKCGDKLFKTQEQAETYKSLEPYHEDYDYRVGWDRKYAVKSIIDPQIVTVRLYSREILEEHRSLLEKKKAVEESNDKLRNEYNKLLEENRKATTGMWEDWKEACSTRFDLMKVIDTYNDYKKTCEGDGELALKFLNKIYSYATIQKAINWFKDSDLSNDYISVTIEEKQDN